MPRATTRSDRPARPSRLARVATLAAATLLATLAGGCSALQGGAGEDAPPAAGQKELAELRAEVAKLQRGQAAVLASLGRLERRLGSAGREAAPARPRIVRIEQGSSPVKGPESARVSIVAFSDFQCPYCARVLPLLEQLREAYPEDVKVVFKQFPLSMHKQARPAALAALAAGRQGKFWEMHDLLFANQKDLSPEAFERHASALGLDLERFRADLGDPELSAQINAEMMQGREAGVAGTPALYVNGYPVQDRSPEGMKALIDAALQATKIREAGDG